MRRWQSHKIVEAEQITSCANTITNKTVTTSDGLNAHRHEVPESFFARGLPDVGDYLVIYEDGYMSWSPKKAFEEGYTPHDAGLGVKSWADDMENIQRWPGLLATGWLSWGEEDRAQYMVENGLEYDERGLLRYKDTADSDVNVVWNLKQKLNNDNNMPPSPTTPDRWEYTIAALPLHPNDFNERGAEGWELVAATGTYTSPPSPHNTARGHQIFIFKRKTT